MKIIPEKLKTFLTRRKGAGKSALINPERDWHVLLCLFAIGLLALALLHYVIYLKLNTISVVETQTPPARLLRKADLTRLVSEYRAKEQALDTLLQTPPAGIEPTSTP